MGASGPASAGVPPPPPRPAPPSVPALPELPPAPAVPALPPAPEMPPPPAAPPVPALPPLPAVPPVPPVVEASLPALPPVVEASLPACPPLPPLELLLLPQAMAIPAPKLTIAEERTQFPSRIIPRQYHAWAHLVGGTTSSRLGERRAQRVVQLAPGVGLGPNRREPVCGWSTRRRSRRAAPARAPRTRNAKARRHRCPSGAPVTRGDATPAPAACQRPCAGG